MTTPDKRVGIRIEGDAQGFVAATVQAEAASRGLTDRLAGQAGAQVQATRAATELTDATQVLAAANAYAEQEARQLAEMMRASAQAHQQAARFHTDLADAVTVQYAAQVQGTRATKEGADQMVRAGMSAGQYQMAMRQLPMQITDVVTSLASGMPVWLVAIQQGGQIRDSFGGAGNAIEALTSKINPAVVGLGALAAIGGAVVAGFVGSSLELAQWTRTLELSGGAVATTGANLQDMTTRVREAAGGLRGGVVEPLQAMAASGRVAAADLERLTLAAVELARVGGPAALATARQFIELGRSPSEAALRLNESTNFLTMGLLRQIQALEGAGRASDAARLAQQAYADAIDGRTDRIVEQLGWIERGWNGIKDAVSGAVDAVAGWGRTSTPSQRLDEINRELSDADALASVGQGPRGINYTPEMLRLEALREEGRQISRDLLRQQNRATDTALSTQQFRDAQAAQSENRRFADMAMTPSERLARDMEQLRRNNETIRRAGGEVDAGAELRQQLALIADFQQRAGVFTAPKQGNRLPEGWQEAASWRGPFEGQPTVPNWQPAQQPFREGPFEADEIDMTARAAAWREYREGMVQTAMSTAQQMREANDLDDVYAITNAEARGRALIDIEERQARSRIDLTVLSAEQKKEVEEEFARWRVAREKQLTEDLKPEWRRMVDGWGDSTKLMQDMFDQTVLGTLRLGEDAFVKFVQTGKLSIKELTDYLIEQSIRLAFRNLVGQGFASLFGGGGGSSPEGFPGNPLYSDGGRATGGPTRRGRRYMVGENGPELLQMGDEGGWITSNERIRAAMGGGGGGGTGVVAVTLNNQSGTAMQVGGASMGEDGRLEVLLLAVDDFMADRVSSGIGSFSSALGSTYGLQRSFGSR
jgi:hypothetical protein